MVCLVYIEVLLRYKLSLSYFSLTVIFVCENSAQLWPLSVYNPLTGACIWSYKGAELQSECLSDVTVVSNEYLFMSVSKRPLTLAVGFESKNRLFQRSVLPAPLQCLVATSDGSVCCGSVNEKLYTWVLTNGHLMSVVSGHYQHIKRIQFTSDDCYLISACKGGTIVVWNVGDLLTSQDNVVLKANPVYKWSAHSLEITDLKIGQGGVAGRVYSVGLDQVAKVHSLSSGELLLTLYFDCPLTCCAIDNAETRLFVGTTKGHIMQIDLFVEPVLRERHVDMALDFDDRILKGHKQNVTSLSTNVDGTLLASGSDDGHVKLWHIISRQCIRTIQCKGPPLKVFFSAIPPALVATDYQSNASVQCLQKTVASDKVDSVVVHLTGFEQKTTESRQLIDDFFDQLLDEQPVGVSGNEEDDESLANDPEYLRRELAKVKRLNKNLYNFCVDKIVGRSSE